MNKIVKRILYILGAFGIFAVVMIFYNYDYITQSATETGTVIIPDAQVPTAAAAAPISQDSVRIILIMTLIALIGIFAALIASFKVRKDHE